MGIEPYCPFRLLKPSPLTKIISHASPDCGRYQQRKHHVGGTPEQLKQRVIPCEPYSLDIRNQMQHYTAAEKEKQRRNACPAQQVGYFYPLMHLRGTRRWENSAPHPPHEIKRYCGYDGCACHDHDRIE